MLFAFVMISPAVNELVIRYSLIARRYRVSAAVNKIFFMEIVKDIVSGNVRVPRISHFRNVFVYNG